MKYTRKQRANIKSYWQHYDLVFKSNGEIYAKRPGGTIGILYTKNQVLDHLKVVGLL